VWAVPTGDLLEELWRQQSIWSRCANRMKTRIGRARSVSLAVVVAMAVFGALASSLAVAQPQLSRVLAGFAAFMAALLPLLRPGWSGRALRDWTRARSVSEALKSEVYLWLARVENYRDDERAVLLWEKTDQIRRDGDDLLRHCAEITPEQRALPPVHDTVSYFAERVAGQVHRYYRPKARALQSRLRWFRRTELTLAMIAALLGALTAVFGGSLLAPWIAVVTTISTAVVVHVAATRDEYQLIEFLRTADRLEQLRIRASGAASSDELNALAVSAEQVISIENQGWMAKLAEDVADHKPAGSN